MKKEIGRVFLIWFFIFFGLGVFLNIYFSQNHPQLLWYLLMRQEKSGAASYLTQIKNREDFSSELEYFKEIYGAEFEKEFFDVGRARRQEISKLHLLLEKNPSSRDVLRKLAILYYLEENKNKAKEYYLKAKAVDPEIKIEELERIY